MADMIYFEDVIIGQKHAFGNYHVTREEVLDFAQKYDPQTFHLSDDAAAKTHFGKISASGWHSCAMTMRMMVDNMHANPQAGLGSPGVDEIRWLKPVYPDDILRCESVTTSKRRSKSRPEMGSMEGAITVYNQNDEKVLTMKTIGLIGVREPRQG